MDPHTQVPPEVRLAVQRAANRRTRRLRHWAYGLMIALTCLLLGNVRLRMDLPHYADPQLLPGDPAPQLTADEYIPALEGVSSRLHTLEAAGSVQLPAPRARWVRLNDALLMLTERRCSIVRDGRAERTTLLHIDWDIHEALLSPDGKTLEVFGLSDPLGGPDGRCAVHSTSVSVEALLGAAGGTELEVASTEIRHSKAGARTGRLKAARAGDITYVGYTDLMERTLRIDGLDGRSETFTDVERFAMVPTAGGLLVLTCHNRFEGFGHMVLSTFLIPPKGDPIRGAVDISDGRLMGRIVTGMDAIPAGDDVLLALSRSGSLETARLRTEGGKVTLREPLSAVAAHPPGVAAASMVLAPVLLACSIGLIHFGVGLYREKRRLIARVLKVRLISPYAGRVERGFAYLIDLLLLVPLATFSWDLLGVNHTLVVWGASWDTWVFLLTLLGLQFIYSLVLEAAMGQTIGKKILGIRVRSADGSRAGFGAILARNLLRTVEASPFTCLIGLVVMTMTERSQRLGDLWARTVVVPVEKVRALDLESEATIPEPAAPAAPDGPRH